MNKKGHFNNELAFGVELEILIPRGVSQDDVVAELNSYQGITARREGYNHDIVEYWKMTTDCTVKSLSLGHTHYGGNELVSPKLYGQDGKTQLEIVLEVLNRMNCKVNKTCGTHVHHDVTDVMLKNIDVVKRFLKNMIKTVMKFEHIIYRLIAPSRLKKIGRGYWTIPARAIFGKVRYEGWGNDLTVKSITSVVERNIDRDCLRKYEASGPGVDAGTNPYSTQNSRYCGLNLKNIWTRGSVEFRYHQGTINFNKLWAWIVFTQSLVTISKVKKGVNFTNIPKNSAGMFHLRKAVGFIGSKDRCEEVKFANKVLTKRFEDMSTSAMERGRRSTKFYYTIKEQLQKEV